MQPDNPPYHPAHPIRLVTAASLFDGHDAAINLMRRMLQRSGAEIIHLGHNRSVAEIVDCAIQEDVQGVAVTSYQGGHLEFFKYMHDLLHQRGAGHMRIFGGGGGTILPAEAAELHAYGITRLYSPDDGRAMGLQGMINDVLQKCDFPVVATGGFTPKMLLEGARCQDPLALGRLISLAENDTETYEGTFGRPLAGLELPESDLLADGSTPEKPAGSQNRTSVLGITGTGGAGKSSMVDELVRRYLRDFPGHKVAILSVDPSKRKTGGALLGDRIRMNAIFDPRVYMRSLATRQANLALSRHVRHAVDICRAAAFDLIVLETSGIGQSDTEIVDHADVSLYLMTSDYGAASQLEKIDMLDFADVVAINKFDKRGSLDALRDVRKQYRRNRNRWDGPDEMLPIYGTVASQFNDAGTNTLYQKLVSLLNVSSPAAPPLPVAEGLSVPPDVVSSAIIPPERVRYLAEIVEKNTDYDQFVEAQVAVARRLYHWHGVLEAPAPIQEAAQEAIAQLERQLHPDCRQMLDEWDGLTARYRAVTYQYTVRDKVVELPLHTETLSGLRVPKVCLPRYADWGDRLRWLLTENVPGEFPFAAGTFPLKRAGEDPTRMFAGEGGPERTNRRFHYLSKGMPAKRLSTAFDSVTLYGENPDARPDIYGKVGMSGVSVCTLDDAKKLYSGFDLCHPATSVSMTINGPAPMLLGFFLNAAIDQQCERHIRQEGIWDEIKPELPAAGFYKGPLPDGHDGLGLLLLGTTGDRVLPREVYERIKADTLAKVRGTVQADILKEDQAQNTCIFSTEFALRMMGDIQQYFIDCRVQNFYSVSVSGYHIAEAGANPISQLAFTLSNAFTLVEYYLSRGMAVDEFAPSLSFFFSNGLDPEYAVMGRVARRIWAKAMKHKYKANTRSQRLKYHIQTSGRSLHAQEIAFNDIRTTLQALCAIYDNCNSLHTNAYDEAITTPTEESVRRAMAIQLIINGEWGLARNENPLQGAFIIEELTDLVEQAVYREFMRLNERGGVLGAMETMYQRSRIQEESLHYETMKHDGTLPIIGVNTFLDPAGSPTVLPVEVFRSTPEEKDFAIASKGAFEAAHREEAGTALAALQQAAIRHENVFASLMEACKCCSLGQLSKALYGVGGQYRRNM